MFTPAAGAAGELADILSSLATLHAQLREMNKHLVILDAQVWELHKQQLGEDYPYRTDSGNTSA